MSAGRESLFQDAPLAKVLADVQSLFAPGSATYLSIGETIADVERRLNAVHEELRALRTERHSERVELADLREQRVVWETYWRSLSTECSACGERLSPGVMVCERCGQPNVTQNPTREWTLALEEPVVGLDGCACPGPDTCMGPPCSSVRRRAA